MADLGSNPGSSSFQFMQLAFLFPDPFLPAASRTCHVLDPFLQAPLDSTAGRILSCQQGAETVEGGRSRASVAVGAGRYTLVRLILGSWFCPKGRKKRLVV